MDVRVRPNVLGISHRYQLSRRLGWPQNWSAHLKYEINLLSMLGFKPQIDRRSDYSDFTILAPECRTNMYSDTAPVSKYDHLL
jgi:hypothetical protein